MQTLQSSIFPTFFIGEAIHFPRDEVHPAHGAEVEQAARAAVAARKSPTCATHTDTSTAAAFRHLCCFLSHTQPLLIELFGFARQSGYFAFRLFSVTQRRPTLVTLDDPAISLFAVCLLALGGKPTLDFEVTTEGSC
jgi:hypothetical protein